ncbi:uncharacterized protein LOC143255436 isoform X1 [Tachypleus tridentatus]|uniref:uncharacterized protein LOC143255436 isoform X1 n=1 Tax=Tachypleus tridentatus TaxID=6853 RepID=UPI003FD32265
MQMEISFTDLARLESECQQLRNEVLHYKMKHQVTHKVFLCSTIQRLFCILLITGIETQYLALQVSRHTTLLLGKGLTATQL